MVDLCVLEVCLVVASVVLERGLNFFPRNFLFWRRGFLLEREDLCWPGVIFVGPGLS